MPRDGKEPSSWWQASGGGPELRPRWDRQTWLAPGVVRSEDGGREQGTLPPALIYRLKPSKHNTCRNSADPGLDPFKRCLEPNIPANGRFRRVLPLPTNVHVSLTGVQLAPQVWRPPAAVEETGGQEQPRAQNNPHKWEWRVLFQISQVWKKMKEKKKAMTLFGIFSLYINRALSWKKKKQILQNIK